MTRRGAKCAASNTSAAGGDARPRGAEIETAADIAAARSCTGDWKRRQRHVAADGTACAHSRRRLPDRQSVAAITIGRLAGSRQRHVRRSAGSSRAITVGRGRGRHVHVRRGHGCSRRSVSTGVASWRRPRRRDHCARRCCSVLAARATLAARAFTAHARTVATKPRGPGCKRCLLHARVVRRRVAGEAVVAVAAGSGSSSGRRSPCRRRWHVATSPESGHTIHSGARAV